MRDRTTEINILQDTLQILKQGYYEKNRMKISLKLSKREMEEIQVFLPEDVKRISSGELISQCLTGPGSSTISKNFAVTSPLITSFGMRSGRRLIRQKKLSRRFSAGIRIG